MSQLEDLIDAPMGPGLKGDEAPGQSVHPQAAQPEPQDAAGEPALTGRVEAGDAQGATKSAPGEPIGSQIASARVGLGDGELRSAEAGGSGPTAGDVGDANAAGFGATLGSKDPDPRSTSPAAAVDGAGNEQSDARLAQARAQGGRADLAAPDQTRATGEVGSINDTDGL